MEVYGFKNVVSKNNVMDSYKKGKMRLNHYFTTGTVTIQDSDGSLETHRNIHTDKKIEDIICKIN